MYIGNDKLYIGNDRLYIGNDRLCSSFSLGLYMHTYYFCVDEHPYRQQIFFLM